MLGPGLKFLRPSPAPVRPDEANLFLEFMELEFLKPIESTLWRLWDAHAGISKVRLARIIEPGLATRFLKAAEQTFNDVPLSNQGHLQQVASCVEEAHPQYESLEESQSESESEPGPQALTITCAAGSQPSASARLQQQQQQKQQSLEHLRSLCEEVMGCMKAWKAEKAAKDKAREYARRSYWEEPMRLTAGIRERNEACKLARWMWCFAREEVREGPDRARFARVVRRLRMDSIADSILAICKVSWVSIGCLHSEWCSCHPSGVMRSTARATLS